MSRSITEQIEDLQNENARLKEFEKLFEKAVKSQFGTGAKSIRKMLKNEAENTSDFEKKICSYFGLKTAEEKAEFLEIMCNDSSLRYYNGKRNDVQAEQQG